MTRLRRPAVGSSSPSASVTGGLETQTVPSYNLRQRQQPRDAELVQAVLSVDTATDPADRERLVRWIREAYDNRGGGMMLGLFSRCYLGHPFLDHRMDPVGVIIEHFELDEEPPPPYAAARPLARSPHYAYLEIYADGQVVPVRHDGTPAL